MRNEAARSAILAIVLFASGFIFGTTYRADSASATISDLEDRLGISTQRSEELASANRNLRERQQDALGIIERTTDNLAAAGATVGRIDDILDRIIGTVADLEQVYNLLEAPE